MEELQLHLRGSALLCSAAVDRCALFPLFYDPLFIYFICLLF